MYQKNIEYIDLESNFLQNSENKKTEEITESQIREFPPTNPIKLNKRPSNKRKKPTIAQTKARIYHFKQYKEPQDLAYHYPLNNEDCAKLQSKSGRMFCLTAMNEILLDMSKRLDLTFKSKAQFIYYFGKCLSGEKRDAVQTDNINFKIKANITDKDRNYAKRESFLSRVECKAHDLENRTTDGFQKVSVLGILDKLQIC